MDAEMQRVIRKMQEDIDKAKHTAESAVASIASHESICLLRYDNINTKLDVLPKIFDRMDSISSKVNQATGVWIGVLGIGGLLTVIYTLIRLTGKA